MGGKCQGRVSTRKKFEGSGCLKCVASWLRAAVYIPVVWRSHVDFGRLIIVCSDGNRDGRRRYSLEAAL